jgi:Rha family phage regulatory protein
MKALSQDSPFIRSKGGQLFTTSIDVAEKFGKRHDKVLRKISELNDPRVSISTAPHLGDSIEKVREWFKNNFVSSEYLGENGKSLPMFEMTRSGFTILAMGFTGIKATEWKIKYEQAFSAMEQALLNQKNLSWQDQRNQGKLARREVTDTISEFIEYAKRQGSKNANYYYANITKATYKCLFVIESRYGNSFRDLLSTMQLQSLGVAEFIAADAIEEGMSSGLHYKEIYQFAKSKVEAFASTLPRKTKVISTPQLKLISKAA